MKSLFFTLSLAVFTTCSSPEPVAKDVLLHNDFDSLAGWVTNDALSRARAHSGHYSVRVGPDHEYGINYLTTLGELSDRRIRGVKLDGWIYMTDKQATASIALVLKDPTTNKEVFNYVPFKQTTTYGEWVKISKDIIFPDSVNYATQMKIYLWRSDATSPAYLDDLQLSAIR